MRVLEPGAEDEQIFLALIAKSDDGVEGRFDFDHGLRGHVMALHYGVYASCVRRPECSPSSSYRNRLVRCLV